MTMTRIVVLANSWKHHDWCLAGIDLDTGKWVRPVTNLDDGRIPKKYMRLGGHFPELLDVLEIPLHSTGPDFGFESENRTILQGRWLLRNRMTPKDLENYAQRTRYVLHNRGKYVTTRELQRKPFAMRVTLQLIRVDNFIVRDARRETTDKHNWKGTILSGGRKLDVGITDPVFIERLNSDCKPSPSCFLTISLTMPYKPPDWDEDEEPVCWKLIAGVIELQKKP
jgi:hypothetical protein